MKKFSLILLGVVCSFIFFSCSQNDDLAGETAVTNQSKSEVINPDGTKNLYLYQSASGHYKFTTDLSVVGASKYEVYGRVYATQQPSSKPIYSAYTTTGGYTLSVDLSEITGSFNGAWTVGAMLGYGYDLYFNGYDKPGFKYIVRAPLWLDLDSEMARFDDFTGGVTILQP